MLVAVSGEDDKSFDKLTVLRVDIGSPLGFNIPMLQSYFNLNPEEDFNFCLVKPSVDLQRDSDTSIPSETIMFSMIQNLHKEYFTARKWLTTCYSLEEQNIPLDTVLLLYPLKNCLKVLFILKLNNSFSLEICTRFRQS